MCFYTLRLVPPRMLSMRAERMSGLGGVEFSVGICGGTGAAGISIGGGGGGGGGTFPVGGGGATGLETAKIPVANCLCFVTIFNIYLVVLLVVVVMFEWV